MRVTCDGSPVELGGRRPATVLASLALAAGRPVGMDRLIDLVWGDDPPRSARRTLQSYVAGLRTALGGDDGPICRRGGGYVLDIQPAQVDLLCLEDLLGSAANVADEKPDEMIRVLRETLSLSGPPLDGLEPSLALRAVVAPYEELLLAGLELLNDLELEHGEAGTAVARLSSLTRECPLRERFWAQLVRGLTILGRRDQALFAMQRAREVLREELGVGPGPVLANVERALLADEDPTVQAVAISGRIDSPGAQIPVPSTELIGKAAELRRTIADLGRHRLVTLTGPGGVGKTRLAIETARTIQGDFADGVYFVELASIDEPSAVAAACASALSVGPQHGGTVASAIVGRLVGRRVLVVVDNCEHVVAATAALIAVVTASCATVTVLATSRQPLGVAGERVHVVTPLDPASEGVEMFLACAAAADASFTPATTDVRSIDEICRRLSGIPLAIELAASRMRALTPHDLLDHLDGRFGLLRSVATDSTTRHHTMTSAVDWSYQLLDRREQLTFDRAAVFADGFDLAAAESVCADEEVPADLVASVIGSLVDKSMVLAERQSGGVRYRLLEPLRQYGAESLTARGDTTRLRTRHLEHYLRLAMTTRRTWLSARQIDAEDVFKREWSNFRSAVDAAICAGTLTAAGAIIDAIAPHAWTRIEYEHGDWSRRLLDQATQGDDVSPTTYGWAAYWTFLGGGSEEARSLARRGIAAAPTPTHPSTAWCWATATWALLSGGIGGDEAAIAASQAERATRSSDGFDRSGALCALIEEAIGRGGTDVAEHVNHYGYLARQIESPSLLARAALYDAALVTELLAHPARRDPRAVHQVGLELARSVGDVNNEGKHLLTVAAESMRMRRPDAQAVTSEVLDRLYTTRHWTTIWLLLDYATEWLAATGRRETAAIVLGHLEAHRPSWHYARARQGRSRASRATETMANAGALMAAGAGMSRDDIVHLVIDGDHATRRGR